MEPITVSTAFASIVSLIGQYRSEHRDAKDDKFDDFIEWLVSTDHGEIKILLEENTKLTIGIKALLNQKYELLVEKLENMDSAFAAFASTIDGFAEIVEEIKPDSVLSEQALNILVRIEESGGSKIVKHQTYGGILLLVLGGKGNQIKPDEPRFIEDDLKVLVSLCLLRIDYDSKGKEMYFYTRAASKLVNSIGC